MTPLRIDNPAVETFRWSTLLIGSGIAGIFGFILGSVLWLLGAIDDRLSSTWHPVMAFTAFAVASFAIYMPASALFRYVGETHWIEVGSRFVYRDWRGAHAVDWNGVESLRFEHEIISDDEPMHADFWYYLQTTLVIRLLDGKRLELPGSLNDRYTFKAMVEMLLEGSSEECIPARLTALRALGRMAPDVPPGQSFQESNGPKLEAQAKADVERSKAILNDALAKIVKAIASMDAEEEAEVRRAAIETADRIRASLARANG